MPPADHPPADRVAVPGSGVTRRMVVAGAGVLGATFLAGCTPSTTAGRRTVTVVASTPPPADFMGGLIAVTRLHVFRLQAATAALTDRTQSAQVAALAKDRSAHLQALTQEWARTDPAAAGAAAQQAPVSAPPSAVTLPTDPKLIIGSLRADAADAQSTLTDALSYISRYRAALFGSIIASLATHRVVLS